MRLLRVSCPGPGARRYLANKVADHLVEASLSGIESHGIMRVLQYAEQMQQGYMRAQAGAMTICIGGGNRATWRQIMDMSGQPD